MTKIKWGFVLAVFFTITIGIVSKNMNHNKFSDYREVFDDSNKVVQDYDIYFYLIKKGQNINNTSNLVFKFSGMDTIWKIKAQNEGVLHISYDSVIDYGEFKLLLITTKNEIIKILKDSESGEKDIQISKGISRIKMVGREAEGSLKITLTGNRWLDIIPINN